jgi:hypothetical protein
MSFTRTGPTTSSNTSQNTGCLIECRQTTHIAQQAGADSIDAEGCDDRPFRNEINGIAL